jgi:hypothetical protein
VARDRRLGRGLRRLVGRAARRAQSRRALNPPAVLPSMSQGLARRAKPPARPPQADAVRWVLIRAARAHARLGAAPAGHRRCSAPMPLCVLVSTDRA